MKKISLFSVLALLPMASFATENNNKWNPRFFIEYDLSVYSERPIDIDLEDAQGVEDIINLKSFNDHGGLYMGADFNGIQLGVETTGSTGLKVKGTVPFFDWVVKPYLSAEVGIANIDLEVDLSSLIPDAGKLEIDDMTINYAFGLGAKYDINDNFFVKLGAKYDIKKYDLTVDIVGEKGDLTIDMSGMTVNFGIGYRF